MSMSCVLPSIFNPGFKSFSHSKIYRISVKPVPLAGFTSSNYLLKFPHKYLLKFPRFSTNRYLVNALTRNGEDEDAVDDLRVPNHWLDRSKASEESEWLRVTLLKWLDDEYCPEATNIKISDIASRAFFNALMTKQTDLGEILLDMVRDLESISYQESFHGAFSSANAAIALIIQRIQPH